MALRRGLIIHAKGSRARHIKPRALRSSIALFITCQRCQQQQGLSTMTANDIRRMSSMVRAIRAGHWTTELPSWAGDKSTRRFLQQSAETLAPELRAAQTAEAFILLAFACRYPLNVPAFLKACGFPS